MPKTIDENLRRELIRVFGFPNATSRSEVDFNNRLTSDELIASAYVARSNKSGISDYVIAELNRYMASALSIMRKQVPLERELQDLKNQESVDRHFIENILNSGNVEVAP
jgi:hypothetical protein